MVPAGCRWTNTAPSSRAIIACPAMPMYGSSAAGLPSGLATVNVRDASRFTTGAESPRCHVIVDPSLSTAESVFPLPRFYPGIVRVGRPPCARQQRHVDAREQRLGEPALVHDVGVDAIAARR